MFHKEGDQQPLCGGIVGSRKITDAKQLGLPWEKCVFHGESRRYNEQRKGSYYILCNILHNRGLIAQIFLEKYFLEYSTL